MWTAWGNPRLEHLRLVVHNSGVVADGMVLGLAEGHPFRVAYEVHCDAGWRVSAARAWASLASRQRSSYSPTGRAMGRRTTDCYPYSAGSSPTLTADSRRYRRSYDLVNISPVGLTPLMGYVPRESLENLGLLLSSLLGGRLPFSHLRGLLDSRSFDLLYLLTTRLSRSAAEQEQYH